MLFKSYFGTTLLKQCPVSNTIKLYLFISFFACFWLFRKWILNEVQTWSNFIGIFSRPEGMLKGPGGGQKSYVRATSSQGAPLSLWAPCSSVQPNSSPINSHILPNQQRATRNTFSATASLCSSAIPYGCLFQYSVRGGIGHWGP